MSELEEVAKAAAEASKFGTKALETTEKLLGFLSRVFAEPLEQVSGILGDRLKFLRWRRQVRIVDEVNALLKQRGIFDLRPLPVNLALTILENASMEENDEIQDIWNKLLANAMDPNFKNEIRTAYIDIIKSLSPLDARVLLAVFRNVNSFLPQQPLEFIGVTRKGIQAQLQIGQEEALLSIQNLFRVQCLALATDYAKFPVDEFSQIYAGGFDEFSLTLFGYRFVETCLG
ncbi:Abi-alpha family protein [Leptospira licerasiae]|uniref:PF14337 domain protein n=1 Tax=Leptospira licerasiae str. MMD4847 TaxID=1049971 RepID=A0ABN0HEB1_9LEPT|nr:Abi-alpha family protein [Leptospira licerasiae]EIE01042.1 hypothetical protein LEP1GSC185_3869 [Leptospira licerasiae serovar Varillal str. VAR 010]EJZ43957.1 PF14337 domain protein [Leptospira licerasiae str. MMD4847]